MACACRSGKKGVPANWVVTLPGGKQKSYASEIAARAEVTRVQGATLTPPPGASV
ncbi:hypothetical protein SEA_TEMPO_23 [Microbacterium phage Tempo]|nr:hypothetical protein SEA_TEMPO_23 [Microbacterium phage Tempo]QKO02775.1 hypothetical protein SEA_KELCOLE_22 [Microbacterium phage Kelcole]